MGTRWRLDHFMGPSPGRIGTLLCHHSLDRLPDSYRLAPPTLPRFLANCRDGRLPLAKLACYVIILSEQRLTSSQRSVFGRFAMRRLRVRAPSAPLSVFPSLMLFDPYGSGIADQVTSLGVCLTERTCRQARFPTFGMSPRTTSIRFPSGETLLRSRGPRSIATGTGDCS